MDTRDYTWTRQQQVEYVAFPSAIKAKLEDIVNQLDMVTF